jgi:antitoxin ParD1/3/4
MNAIVDALTGFGAYPSRDGLPCKTTMLGNRRRVARPVQHADNDDRVDNGAVMDGVGGSVMAGIERLTITLPSDMAAVVKGAVDAGDYASSSEVVREALRDWKMKRAIQLKEMEALKADIGKGLTDLAEGRVKDFNDDRIIARGRKLLGTR